MWVEHTAKRVVDGNVQMLVPWILIASYAYFQLSRPLVSDATYDLWCRRLHRVKQHRIITHQHRNLIVSGPTTCHVLLKGDQYPSIIVSVTHRLLERNTHD